MLRAAIVAIGLLLWTFPLAARADEYARCVEPGYLAHFDERLSPQTCDEITTAEIHWRGRTALLRAVHPRAMSITDSAVFIARIHETAAAVGAAMDTMGGDLNLDDVTVVFTNYVSPREAGPDEGFDKGGYIAAAATTFAHECPVSYYKGMHRSVGEEFTFTLAHEIFHCVQYRTWPSMLEQEWLIEGSAEYFAFLAFPTYAGDNGFIAGFDAQIPGTALRDLSYSAVVFHLWLGDAYGPPRVREFIGAARALESAVEPDMWIEFAQAYFDQRIHLPNGAALASAPQIGGVRNIHGDDRLDMPPAAPFTLNNAIFAFDRDRIYDLSYQPSAPDVRMRWRKADGGAWEPPLLRVSTCDGEQRYRVIWASTRSADVGDIDVHAEPVGASMCACPAGVWQETAGSLRHMMEQSALPGGASQIRFISGRRMLRLNPDHTGSFTYEDVVTETHSSADFWLRQTKNGGTHFTWRVVNGMLLTVLVAGDNLLTLHNEQHTPSGVRVEDRRAGAQSIGHTFSCDDAGLHLTQHNIPPSPIPGMGGISVDMDFTRVGGVPAPAH